MSLACHAAAAATLLLHCDNCPCCHMRRRLVLLLLLAVALLAVAADGAATMKTPKAQFRESVVSGFDQISKWFDSKFGHLASDKRHMVRRSTSHRLCPSYCWLAACVLWIGSPPPPPRYSRVPYYILP